MNGALPAGEEPEKSARGDAADGQGASEEDPGPPTLWEWLTLGVSLLIVLTLAGLLWWQSRNTARPNQPDAVPLATAEIRTAEVHQRDNVYLLPLRVRNVGNIALESVKVRVTLRDRDGKEDEREVEFAVLPEGATEEAFIVSPTPPKSAKPEAEVLSFQTRPLARGY
jgi:uncharacterized protein (TIGR02588 family)